ncbi:retrovirus-related pol polyprotein from transposon TNT 1-94 [Tanacetum coccineum]
MLRGTTRNFTGESWGVLGETRLVTLLQLLMGRTHVPKHALNQEGNGNDSCLKIKVVGTSQASGQISMGGNLHFWQNQEFRSTAIQTVMSSSEQSNVGTIQRLKITSDSNIIPYSEYSQEKDTVIKKLKERIKVLSGIKNEDKIKQALVEIETLNLELDHRHGLVCGLPKLKFEKGHLCSACAMGKSKKKPHKPKSKDTHLEKLYLLHMDLCGPMRVVSVNEEDNPVIIMLLSITRVNDVSRKDDNGTEFVNQTLREYYEKIDISLETFVSCSPQQNGVVERCNRTLIEAARIMLIYAKALLFLWVEAIATACYTQNCSVREPGRIIEPIHVDFDELNAMAFEHSSSGPALHEMTPATINSGLVSNPPPSTPFVPPSRTDWDILYKGLKTKQKRPTDPDPAQDRPDSIAPVSPTVEAGLTGGIAVV